MSDKIDILDETIRVKLNNKIKETKMNSPVINDIRNLSGELVESLIKNGADWKINDNVLVFNLVRDVTKFVKKHKNLSHKEKQELGINTLIKIITDEINKRSVDENLKKLILDGVDVVVEPALELAILAATNNISFKDCKCMPKKK